MGTSFTAKTPSPDGVFVVSGPRVQRVQRVQRVHRVHRVQQLDLKIRIVFDGKQDR